MLTFFSSHLTLLERHEKQPVRVRGPFFPSEIGADALGVLPKSDGCGEPRRFESVVALTVSVHIARSSQLFILVSICLGGYRAGHVRYASRSRRGRPNRLRLCQLCSNRLRKPSYLLMAPSIVGAR